MVQKIRKAQALTEMAIFGTLILLCLHYLLSYIQRMDRQQYLLQESFRSALEKASNPAVGSVGYNIFSNRRQVSINSPLIGERSQLSGSGQVYWGVPKYVLSDDGEDVEIKEELESKQYYRFNKDEIDLTDNLKVGTVTADELFELTSDSDGLWLDLVNNGYIDDNGNFSDDFANLEDSSKLELDNEYENKDEDELTKSDIYSFLQSEQNANPEITIASGSDRDSVTKITYSGNNISSESRAGEKDVVTYTLKDKDNGAAIYIISQGLNADGAISQGLNADGEYSQAAFLADKKVYNIMSPDNSDRVWVVPK